jgi:hypothetical protein
MDFLRIRFIIPKGYSFELKDNEKLTLKTEQGTLKFKISTSEADSYRIYCFKSMTNLFAFHSIVRVSDRQLYQ